MNLKIINPQLNWIDSEVSNEKKKVIEKCDGVFIDGILKKKNYRDIFDKIDRNAYLIVSYDINNPIGYAALYANDYENRIAYISMIGVISKMQGRHIGSQLLDKCIELAKREGMYFIKLEVYKKNEKAIEFYKRKGFKAQTKSSEEKIYMVKDI